MLSLPAIGVANSMTDNAIYYGDRTRPPLSRVYTTERLPTSNIRGLQIHAKYTNGAHGVTCAYAIAPFPFLVNIFSIG